MKGSLRSLARVFLPGVSAEAPFELPQGELDKLRKVLRLGSRDRFAVLPNDGTMLVCRLEGRNAHPERVERPKTEPRLRVTLAQALPKGDRLETVIRMGTEIGVSRFVMFPAERSVVRWDASKLSARIVRLEAIARESAEQSFRANLPTLETLPDLVAVLTSFPNALVLSEVEDVTRTLASSARSLANSGEIALVAGPEGGWSPRELERIGDRGVTMGPRVLRTDTAGPAAAAAILIGVEPELGRVP